MTENNVFVKPEKYVWKIRKIGFLEVVIEPDEVKMEKEKVQVVDWPVTKEYKGCTEVFEIGKLLQMIYQRFCKSSKTPL